MTAFTIDYFNDVRVSVLPQCYFAGRVSLQSADRFDFVTPRVCIVRFEQRSFRVAAPNVWNLLPMTVRNNNSLKQFKQHLKTWLFERAHM